MRRHDGAGAGPPPRAGETRRRATAWQKPALFVLALLPFGYLVVALLTDSLGANPVEAITHESGQWALRLLLATLLVTPLRRISGIAALVRFRRMLGLFAFFYLMVHFATYAVLDAGLDPRYVLDDVIERPYISVGFTTLCILVPLAATSTNAMIRRLGGARWRRLHRLAYFAGAGGVLHFLWLAKADLREPLLYLAVLILLLAARIPRVAASLGRLAPRRDAGARRAASPPLPPPETRVPCRRPHPPGRRRERGRILKHRRRLPPYNDPHDGQKDPGSGRGGPLPPRGGKSPAGG